MTKSVTVHRLLREANPVADPTTAHHDERAADELYSAILARTSGRTSRTDPIRLPKPQWYRRPAMLSLVGAAAMIILIVPVVLLLRPSEPAPDETPVATISPETTVTSTTTTTTSLTSTTTIATFPDQVGPWGGTKLEASDPQLYDGRWGDAFGASVAVDGEILVVGAPSRVEAGEWVGLVYVLEPDGEGGWSETILRASDGSGGGQFGMAVAVDGQRIVVGRPYLGSTAYVYDRSPGGEWVETRLRGSYGLFGSSVAVDGNRVVIGAGGDDGNTGAVYVFDQDESGAWVETKLTASDGAPGDFLGHPSAFGYAGGIPVSVDGDRIVAGSYTANGESAVYLFELDGEGGWTETKLASFGYGAAVDGDRIVIGNEAQVHVFEPDGTGGWAEQIVDLPQPGEQLSAGGGRIVVAVRPNVAPPSYGSGPVYILEPDDSGGWSQTRIQAPADYAAALPGTLPSISFSVSTDGTRVLIGDWAHDSSIGITYVYEPLRD
ncbi:MAG: hypothetical protein HKN80_08150 [Acidimicrobiia bacterium]|nr:hypothetical protein [Acidimicrobiia bacterium]